MRIGLYGLPSAGKTHVLEKIDFINVFLGSTCLKKLDPEFDVRSEEEKNKVEAQVQRAFLNMLYEQGLLTDKVCTLAMEQIAEGA